MQKEDHLEKFLYLVLNESCKEPIVSAENETGQMFLKQLSRKIKLVLTNAFAHHFLWPSNYINLKGGFIDFIANAKESEVYNYYLGNQRPSHF